jgi:hypothetical protein
MNSLRAKFKDKTEDEFCDVFFTIFTILSLSDHFLHFTTIVLENVPAETETHRVGSLVLGRVRLVVAQVEDGHGPADDGLRPLRPDHLAVQLLHRFEVLGQLAEVDGQAGAT